MKTIEIWGKEFPTNENIEFETKLNINRTFEFTITVNKGDLKIFPEKPKGIKILEVEKADNMVHIRFKSVKIDNGLDFIKRLHFEIGYYYGITR